MLADSFTDSSSSARYRLIDSETPFLLAADLDGTLLGDPEGEGLLKALALASKPGFHLAVVTGRTLDSVRALVREGRLPQPDFAATCVGSELFDWNDPENKLGARYAARVPANWDLEAVYARGIGEGISRQPFPEGQPPFQAGLQWDGRPESLEAFQSRLARLPGCRVIPSAGMFIDVFPPGFGKGEAVRFLRQAVPFLPDRIVVAGDTGNDVGMFETGFRGIVPSNALEELRAVACKDWHYQSPYLYARGVIDGLLHFGLILEG
jgi:hydroxymethylpyrimidine pyrophosphatase-like HAD family hydrolase